MSNPKRPATYDDPLTRSRVDPYVREVTNTGARMVQDLSDKINTVSVMRAMQLGYIFACQDHGLTPPDFVDPEETMFGNTKKSP